LKNQKTKIENYTFNCSEKWGSLQTYGFFMYQLPIIGTLMSVLAGIISKDYKYSVFAFCVLVGLNWLIALSRQKHLFDEVVEGITNELKISRQHAHL
jgi:hypothetical protein